MTREEILGMALDAGFMISTQYGQKSNQPMPVSDSSTLEKFAALVAAHEREECAAECERMKMFPGGRQESFAHHGVQEAAAAIRAMGNPA